MPQFATGNPEWDHGLATLAQGLFPSAASIAEAGYYGARQREAMLAGNEAINRQNMQPRLLSLLQGSGVQYAPPAYMNPPGGAQPIGAPPIMAPSQNLPMVNQGAPGQHTALSQTIAPGSIVDADGGTKNSAPANQDGSPVQIAITPALIQYYAQASGYNADQANNLVSNVITGLYAQNKIPKPYYDQWMAANQRPTALQSTTQVQTTGMTQAGETAREGMRLRQRESEFGRTPLPNAMGLDTQGNPVALMPAAPGQTQPQPGPMAANDKTFDYYHTKRAYQRGDQTVYLTDAERDANPAGLIPLPTGPKDPNEAYLIQSSSDQVVKNYYQPSTGLAQNNQPATLNPEDQIALNRRVQELLSTDPRARGNATLAAQIALQEMVNAGRLPTWKEVQDQRHNWTPARFNQSLVPKQDAQGKSLGDWFRIDPKLGGTVAPGNQQQQQQQQQQPAPPRAPDTPATRRAAQAATNAQAPSQPGPAGGPVAFSWSRGFHATQPGEQGVLSSVIPSAPANTSAPPPAPTPPTATAVQTPIGRAPPGKPDGSMMYVGNQQVVVRGGFVYPVTTGGGQ